MHASFTQNISDGDGGCNGGTWNCGCRVKRPQVNLAYLWTLFSENRACETTLKKVEIYVISVAFLHGDFTTM